jgi:hypothetical protein
LPRIRSSGSRPNSRRHLQASGSAHRLALLGPDDPTGTYSNDEGPLPW